MDAEARALVALAVARWMADLGLVVLTGAVAGWYLTRRDAEVGRRLRMLAAGAALLAAAGTLARLIAQTYAVFGPDGPVTLELVGVVGLDSRWGGRWQPQAALAGAALVATATIWWRPRLGWPLVGVTTGLSWAAVPWTGHAMSAASVVPWLAQIGHGLAAGLWVGTLIGIVVVAPPLLRRDAGRSRLAELIHRFSPLAVGAVAAIVVTGGLMGWYYLDAVGQLWTTSYGRALALKVAVVLLTGAVGAYNWRRLTPRLATAAGPRTLLRSARAEAALAVVVLGVTAWLVHLAMPAEMG